VWNPDHQDLENDQEKCQFPAGIKEPENSIRKRSAEELRGGTSGERCKKNPTNDSISLPDTRERMMWVEKISKFPGGGNGK